MSHLPVVSPGAVLSLQTVMQLSHPALLSTGATTLVSADTVIAQMCQRTGRQRRLSLKWGCLLRIGQYCFCICPYVSSWKERERIVEFLLLKSLFPDGCSHCLLVPWVVWAVELCAAGTAHHLVTLAFDDR